MRGSRDGQRKGGGGSFESWQATGKELTEPTRLAKIVRRAAEGAGTRDMAERFLRKRIEEGRGTVDGLCLAISKRQGPRKVSVELSGIADHLKRRVKCTPSQTMGRGMVGRRGGRWGRGGDSNS